MSPSGLASTRQQLWRRRSRPAALGITSVLLTGLLLQGTAFSAESARGIPAPAVDEPASTASSEVAVFAGGCFWGVQAVYQHTKGVTNAVSGYAGGTKATADYNSVSYGRSTHAEAVQVTYDPRAISYGKILQIFFSVAHDPTQLDRQGPDTGPQYRSEIFPQDDAQRQVAKAYVAQLDKAKVFGDRIVTKIGDGTKSSRRG